MPKYRIMFYKSRQSYVSHHAFGTSSVHAMPQLSPEFVVTTVKADAEKHTVKSVLQSFGAGVLAGTGLFLHGPSVVAVNAYLNSSQSDGANNYNSFAPRKPGPNVTPDQDSGLEGAKNSEMHFAINKLAQSDGFDAAILGELEEDSQPTKEGFSTTVTLLLGKCSLDKVVLYYTADAHDNPADILTYDLPHASLERVAKTVPVRTSSELQNTRYADCLNVA